MADERRGLSTADLVRNAEAPDRAVKDREVAAEHGTHALFPGDRVNSLRHEWSDIQAAFVDAPREAVQRADALVANTMKQIAEVFAAERQGLEGQWDRGDNVTTEDLRVALQRYRAFFDRLLSL
jgi:hypothetical protein